MNPIYIQELKGYTLRELKELLNKSLKTNLDDCKLIEILKKLKEIGIVKSYKTKSSQEAIQDFEQTFITNKIDNNQTYKFEYVGVVIVKGITFNIYPKYIKEQSSNNSDLLKEKFAKVMQVIKKYKKEFESELFKDFGNLDALDISEIMKFLLEDYFENDVYHSTEELLENNGLGEILWDKSINSSFPIFINKRPYYFDLVTKSRVRNDQDYFCRLHRCVLTEISNYFKANDLLYLVGNREANLSEESLDNFGSLNEILYKLQHELNIQFNTRKKQVLQAIYCYLTERSSISNYFTIGSNSFYVIWEKVCAKIFNNKLDMNLSNLSNKEDFFNNSILEGSLKSLIAKPKWKLSKSDNESLVETATLVPDIITFLEINTKRYFLILDAKYYTPTWNDNSIVGQPGIEAITKQYLYNLAFKLYLQNEVTVYNSFIYPLDDGCSNMMHASLVSVEFLTSLGLADIYNLFLSASQAYDCYLSGNKFSDSDLEQFIILSSNNRYSL